MLRAPFSWTTPRIAPKRWETNKQLIFKDRKLFIQSLGSPLSGTWMTDQRLEVLEGESERKWSLMMMSWNFQRQPFPRHAPSWFQRGGEIPDIPRSRRLFLVSLLSLGIILSGFSVVWLCRNWMPGVLAGKPHSLFLNTGSLQCRRRSASAFLRLDAWQWEVQRCCRGRGKCPEAHLHQQAWAQRQDSELCGFPQGVHQGGSGCRIQQGQHCPGHQVPASCLHPGQRLLWNENWRAIQCSDELQI